MPAKDINTSTPGLDVKEILRELEVPFSPEQVQWRVTVTGPVDNRVAARPMLLVDCRRSKALLFLGI